MSSADRRALAHSTPLSALGGARHRLFAVRTIAVILALAACTDRSPTPPITATPLTSHTSDSTLGVIVSAPITLHSSSAARVGGASATQVQGSGSLVYVSLPPGSVPAGVSATITNQVTGQSLTVPMTNGGFDPVAFAASVGDQLTVVMRGKAGGMVANLNLVVPPDKPPAIVRTDPPPGMTDVPLNTRITIVFSEPVDSASVRGSVQLFGGGNAVGGAATLESSGLLGNFTPDTLLAPQTEYTLTVLPVVRNVSGDTLQSAVQTQFTTGSAGGLSAVPQMLDFGTQGAGTTSAAKTVTLTNTAYQAESVSVSMNGYSWSDFQQKNNCPPTLAARASCTFSITFTPTSIGGRAGLLEVNQDSPYPINAFVNLTGTSIGSVSAALAADSTGTLGQFAYAANSLLNTVSMYRINSDGTLTANGRITAGIAPSSLAVDQSGKFLYVANFESNDVSMFTIAPNGTLTSNGTIDAGSGPVSVAVAPDPTGKFGQFVYVVNFASNDVSMYVVDRGTGALRSVVPGTIGAGYRPWSVAAHPSGRFIYVASRDQSGNGGYLSTVYMYAVDASTGVLTPLLPNGVFETGDAMSPTSIVIDRSGQLAYLTSGLQDPLYQLPIDSSTGALRCCAGNRVDFPGFTSVAVDALGKFGFMTSTSYGGFPSYHDSVSAYSVGTNGFASSLSAQGTNAGLSLPTSIVIDPSGRFAYVSNSGSSTISIYSIDRTNGALALIATIGM